MEPNQEFERHLTRRTFLGNTACGVGQAALGAMLLGAGPAAAATLPNQLGLPHFRPRAKRVLCLFQSEDR